MRTYLKSILKSVCFVVVTYMVIVFLHTMFVKDRMDVFTYMLLLASAVTLSSLAYYMLKRSTDVKGFYVLTTAAIYLALTLIDYLILKSKTFPVYYYSFHRMEYFLPYMITALVLLSICEISITFLGRVFARHRSKRQNLEV